MSDSVPIGKVQHVFDKTGDMRLVLGDPEEMPDYDCPFCDEAMFHEVHQERQMSKAVLAKPSSADICRENGWVAGTVLEGDEGWGMERIVITAVGEHRVLARRESHSSWAEGLWDLHHRVWRQVEASAPMTESKLASHGVSVNESQTKLRLVDDTLKASDEATDTRGEVE